MTMTMTYASWMEKTKSFRHKRSVDLVKIDSAIKERDESAAKKALIEWIKGQNQKRQDWHKSVRNQAGAVEALYDQLGVLGNGPQHKNIAAYCDDALAKVAQRREFNQAAALLFVGKKIKFKDGFSSGGVDVARSMKQKKLNAGGGEVGSMARDAKGIADNIVKCIEATTKGLDTPVKNHVVLLIFGESAATFAANAAPFFGAAASGAKFMAAAAEMFMAGRNFDKMSTHFGDVRPGDPQAALTAIHAILMRQMADATARTVVNGAAAVAKIGGVFADGGLVSGPLVGAVESFAILMCKLIDVVKDAFNLQAGNKLIEEKVFGLELFEKCPILGCYYLAVLDHGAIVNFQNEIMGKENWQLEVERLRYAIQPVLVQARSLIAKSRLEIAGFETMKGVSEQTWMGYFLNAYKSRGYGLADDYKTDKVDGFKDHGLRSAFKWDNPGAY
jgi:hypothetical protein